MKQFVILLISIFSTTPFAESQNQQTVESLEKQYQHCLDKGEFMWECSRNFYGQMDSILNVAYSNLRSKLNPDQQTLLKQEQRAWLKKRDNYFRKTYGEASKDAFNGMILAKDDEMFMYDSNANFVKAQVLYLIIRIEKIKKK